MSARVENNGRTTTLGGITGKGFMPGRSGNPGGRPRGIAAAARKACGDSPDVLMEGLVKIAKGEGTNGKPVRPADQIRAAEIVLAYGWGKPSAVVSIEGQDSLEPDDLTREIAATAAALLERRATSRWRPPDGGEVQREPEATG